MQLNAVIYIIPPVKSYASKVLYKSTIFNYISLIKLIPLSYVSITAKTFRISHVHFYYHYEFVSAIRFYFLYLHTANLTLSTPTLINTRILLKSPPFNLSQFKFIKNLGNIVYLLIEISTFFFIIMQETQASMVH